MKNKSTLWLNLILVILLTLAVWYGRGEMVLLRTAYQKLNELSGENNQTKTWQNLLENSKEERNLIHQSLVTTDSLPDFIDQLEQLATSTRNKLDIASAIPGDKSNPNIKITFSIKGSYNNVLRFTSLIDSLPVQLQLNQASFSRENASGETKPLSLWQARFEIELVNNNLPK